MSIDRKLSRRQFLGSALAVATMTPVASSVFMSAAQAGDLTQLTEDDPTAVALGYVHDAAAVDVSKFPKRAGDAGATQFCSNCSLYQGSEGEEWGACAIFPGKSVKAAGWCNAWVIKA